MTEVCDFDKHALITTECIHENQIWHIWLERNSYEEEICKKKILYDDSEEVESLEKYHFCLVM